MAGRLTISTLNNDTGVLATQNGMTGIAKAWVQYNGSTSTIIGSFNVGSVTKNGTGDYTVNFTTAMPNSNYSAVATSSEYMCGVFSQSTTNCNARVTYATNTGGAFAAVDKVVSIIVISS
jgi:hypothetical protein